MKHKSEKSYWSKTYLTGATRIYAWEREDRGGYVFLKFTNRARAGRDRRDKQKLPGELRVRDPKGRVDKSMVRAVDAAVERFAAQLLLGQRPSLSSSELKSGSLTLSEGFAKVLDIGTGKYPDRTLRWQEVRRARTKLERILGPSRAWVDIKPGDVRHVWRTLASEFKSASAKQRPCGPRQTEVTIDALYSAANWLRDEEELPSDALLAPTDWRTKLKREWQQLVGAEVAPARPRHSREELGRLLNAMHSLEVDPRLALAFDLGGEQRLGQVLRCYRSHLELPAIDSDTRSTCGPGDLGLLRVPGAGHKRASPIVLTSDQRMAVDAALGGYLRHYETLFCEGKIKDYPLFPAHRFRKGAAKVVEHPVSLTRDAALGMFRKLEAVAGVPSLPGRGWYGVRRAAADAAEDVEKDERVLNSITGHRDSNTRRNIYQDRERPAVLNRAAQTRQRLRSDAIAGVSAHASGAPLVLVRETKSA
jgi:integrase